jgi:hypothetical protein
MNVIPIMVGLGIQLPVSTIQALNARPLRETLKTRDQRKRYTAPIYRKTSLKVHLPDT